MEGEAKFSCYSLLRLNSWDDSEKNLGFYRQFIVIYPQFNTKWEKIHRI